MGVQVIGVYNNLPEAAVMMSCLEAGGFHPVLQNYHHATMQSLNIIAFGGITITVPIQELHAARDYVLRCQNNPITDYDPIKLRRFGKWKTGTVLGYVGAGIFGFFLPYFFLPVELQLALWLVWFIWGGFNPLYLASFFLILPLMLLHAKYIALPRVRQYR